VRALFAAAIFFAAISTAQDQQPTASQTESQRYPRGLPDRQDARRLRREREGTKGMGFPRLLQPITSS
jgi:hypothetical protein